MAPAENTKKRKLATSEAATKSEKSKKVKPLDEKTPHNSKKRESSTRDKHAKKKIALSSTPPHANTSQNKDTASAPKQKPTQNDTTLKPQSKLLKSALKKPTNPTTASPKDLANASDFETFSDSSHDSDAQTAALLKGFESSSSSGDASDTEPTDHSDKPVPSIPSTVAQAVAKVAAKSSAEDTPGTLYVGRIPHGFYEHQMRGYFSQFGTITRLRLARNRRTGAPKHYAFIEFASSEVAKIVAATMNNYLMFQHILKVKFIPQDEVHEELWKGAGKRFKRVPWRAMERGNLKSAGRETWRKRVDREKGRREKQREKLKELGYDFEMPDLRAVEKIPVRELGKSEEVKAIEGVSGVETVETLIEEPKSKTKKTKGANRKVSLLSKDGGVPIKV